jgi:hypothetical protein
MSMHNCSKDVAKRIAPTLKKWGYPRKSNVFQKSVGDFVMTITCGQSATWYLGTGPNVVELPKAMVPYCQFDLNVDALHDRLGLGWRANKPGLGTGVVKFTLDSDHTAAWLVRDVIDLEIVLPLIIHQLESTFLPKADSLMTEKGFIGHFLSKQSGRDATLYIHMQLIAMYFLAKHGQFDLVRSLVTEKQKYNETLKDDMFAFRTQEGFLNGLRVAVKEDFGLET